MINYKQDHTDKNEESSFDELMANLFVLLTHHSLTQCEGSLMPIVERLDALCIHSEIELYPNQYRTLAKMRQLWRTKLFKTQRHTFAH